MSYFDFYQPTNYEEEVSKNLVYVRVLNSFPYEKEFGCFEEEFKKIQWEENRKQNQKLLAAKHAGTPFLSDEFEYDFYQIPAERISPAGRPPLDFYDGIRFFDAGRILGYSKIKDIYRRALTDPTFQRNVFVNGIKRAKEGGKKFQIPSYITMTRFDALMTKANIWAKMKNKSVDLNLREGVFKKEDIGVIDVVKTKGFGSLKKMVKDCRICHKEKVNLGCPRCKDSKPCDNPYLTCNATGVVVKNKYDVSEGIRFAVIGLSKQEIGLSVLAFNGSTHEGKTVVPIVEKGSVDFPDLEFNEILVDRILNTKDNRDKLSKDNISLKSGVDARRGNKFEFKSRGITFTVSKHVQIKCEEGNTFQFLTRETKQGRYIFQVTNLEKCDLCEKKITCCPEAEKGKTLRIDRELLPQVDWDNPQISRRAKKKYQLRSGIERFFGRILYFLGFSQVFKRGIPDAQAFGEKVLGVAHRFAYGVYKMGFPEKKLSYSWCLVGRVPIDSEASYYRGKNSGYVSGFIDSS